MFTACCCWFLKTLLDMNWPLHFDTLIQELTWPASLEERTLGLPNEKTSSCTCRLCSAAPFRGKEFPQKYLKVSVASHEKNFSNRSSSSNRLEQLLLTKWRMPYQAWNKSLNFYLSCLHISKAKYKLYNSTQAGTCFYQQSIQMQIRRPESAWYGNILCRIQTMSGNPNPNPKS